MLESLVIVHLSSVDNYIAFYGVKAATVLISDIRVAIIAHSGPVLIMDQGWSEISADTHVLRSSVFDLQQVRPMTLFHHDELCDISPWQDGMRQLARALRLLHTGRVRLGGLWTSQDGSSGCVHEVQRQLRTRNIPCILDKTICALETGDHRVEEAHA